MTLKLDIENVLEAALRGPGTIHVVQASPGQGKTHSTIEALADMMKAGRVSRVLWAVRETKDSFGAEAVAKLRRAGLNANITYGKTTISRHIHSTTGSWGTSSRELAKTLHANHFIWGSSPEVKVVSHAHLELIYGKNGHAKGSRALQPLRKAQLVIIDEDPSDVFLVSDDIINDGRSSTTSRRLRLNSEFFKHKPDTISQFSGF